jgi:hypothetical protein
VTEQGIAETIDVSSLAEVVQRTEAKPFSHCCKVWALAKLGKIISKSVKSCCAISSHSRGAVRADSSWLQSSSFATSPRRASGFQTHSAWKPELPFGVTKSELGNKLDLLQEPRFLAATPNLPARTPGSEA